MCRAEAERLKGTTYPDELQTAFWLMDGILKTGSKLGCSGLGGEVSRLFILLLLYLKTNDNKGCG